MRTAKITQTLENGALFTPITLILITPEELKMLNRNEWAATPNSRPGMENILIMMEDDPVQGDALIAAMKALYEVPEDQHFEHDFRQSALDEEVSE